MVAAFVACSKDDSKNDGDGNGNSGTIKNVTIKDAETVYKSSPAGKSAFGTRAVQNSSFMQITKDGRILPICFITEKGDSIPINARSIVDVNEEFFLMGGLLITLDSSIDFTTGDEIDWSKVVRMLLVNKKTEAVYAIPTTWVNIDVDEKTKAYVDKDNNVYFSPAYNQIVYKINTSNSSNLTVEKYLPEGEEFELGFSVSKNGVCCYYGKRPSFKCPGGRIYPIDQLIPEAMAGSVFEGFNGAMYFLHQSYSELSTPGLYKINELNPNELQAEKVCEFISDGNFNFFVKNPVRKTFVYSDGRNRFEFNEIGNTMTPLDVEIPAFEYNNYNDLVASDGIYIWDYANTLTKMSFADNSVHQIDLSGYECRSFSASPKSAEISFNALRFADGKNVIGQIDSQGRITVFENIQAGSEPITLIKLN